MTKNHTIQTKVEKKPWFLLLNFNVPRLLLLDL